MLASWLVVGSIAVFTWAVLRKSSPRRRQAVWLAAAMLIAGLIAAPEPSPEVLTARQAAAEVREAVRVSPAAEREAARAEREAAREVERAAERAAGEAEETAERQRAARRLAEQQRREAAQAASVASAPCDLSGNIPQAMFDLLCQLASSVHGGDAPVNALTVMVSDGDIAREIRAGSPEAENTLLALLDAWMTQRGVRVAQVDVFYGRAHLATAETHVWRAPSVTFHATRPTQLPADPDPPAGFVSANTWPGEWPLTVENGRLSCIAFSAGRTLEAAFVFADGKLWPLNGVASSHRERWGAEPSIDPIWRVDPQFAGLPGPTVRVSIGEMIRRALELC